MKLIPGSRLDAYEILAALGAGGMGEVYRARDLRLQREVAIKVLPDSVTSDPDRLRRFELEARAAAALNHPNILAVYQMATDDGISYLVSELLEGESLKTQLWRGPLPLRKAMDFAVQLAQGLAAAHARGIVHRDLKPENIFITKDGRVKILDFGLAKIVEPEPTEVHPGELQHAPTLHTMPGVTLGTTGYMSPEQVRGQSVDARSDIFAFGAILHEMVTGKRAFEGQTSADTMSAILTEEPQAITNVLPTIPTSLQRVVQRCMEKNAEQRFQSASDLGFALQELTDSDISLGTRTHTEASRRHGRTVIVIGLLIVLILVLLGILWSRRDSVPKVSNYVQLTHDGQPKALLGTDGARLYLGLGPFPYQAAAEMSASGGEPRNIALPSTPAVPIVLSPDGANLLVVVGQGVPPSGPLWSLPVAGGSPRPLGEAAGETGAWSTDGRLLAYSKNGNLFVANADGSGSRKLSSVPGDISSVSWSADDESLRFDSSEIVGQHQMWEVSSSGGNLHRLLAGWHNPPDECCGHWTADGQQFLFQSGGQIWALAKPGLLSPQPKPVQLTFSPMSLSTPLPGKDGKRVFVVGQLNRGELMRYDLKLGEFSPFLSGISAEYVDFSRDGKWVAYVTYPEGALWRSKTDGSERLQLTYPPTYPMLPRWSPDGTEILFFEFRQDSNLAKIYAISPNGGNSHELMPTDSGQQVDPNWSPDGGKVVFGGNSSDTGSSIRLFDVKMGTISSLPQSQGFFSPRWSPHGEYICALSSDSTRLVLFDLRTKKWTDLAQGSFGWLNWSNDGEYIYVLDQSGSGTVRRVRLKDHHVDPVVQLTKFKTTGRYRGALALAPDNSPLLLRDSGTQDVYALNWVAP